MDDMAKRINDFDGIQTGGMNKLKDFGNIYDINKNTEEIRSHEYVIGDIHGCSKEFSTLVRMIRKKDPEATFIIIGDLIDRGPSSLKMLEWAMKRVNREDGIFKMIAGNHEYMKIEYIENYLTFKREGKINNLMDIEVDPYFFRDSLAINNTSDEIIEKILRFFKDLPLYYETNSMLTMSDGTKKKQHYIIVHGDIGKAYLNENEKVKENSLTNTKAIEDLVWDRNYFGHPELNDTIVIHGHTPTLDRNLVIRGAVPGKIDFKANDINIDCGMVYKDMYYKTGNLAAISLDDLTEYYVYVYNDSDYRMYGRKGNRDIYKARMIQVKENQNKKR